MTWIHRLVASGTEASWAEPVPVWAQKMVGSTQDALHHAEGDVWVHTQWVVRELLADPLYARLPELARVVVFAAAMLHDIAKPRTRVEVEEDGVLRIQNPKHSRIGAGMARELLWRWGMPAQLREVVCGLIMQHQVPFWLLNKPEDVAQRQWIQGSLTAPVGLLTLLARADARGRICLDQAHMLDMCTMYGMLAEDQGCLWQPFPFANALSRREYLLSETIVNPIALHDNRDWTVTLTSGLPGTGKSHWRQDAITQGVCLDQPVVSMDALRVAMKVKPEDDQGAVWQAAKKQAQIYLAAEQPFVWDGVHLSQMSRDRVTQLIRAYGGRVQIALCEVDPATQAARNRARPDATRVPDAVIDRMLARWEFPRWTEADDLAWMRPQGQLDPVIAYPDWSLPT